MKYQNCGKIDFYVGNIPNEKPIFQIYWRYSENISNGKLYCKYFRNNANVDNNWHYNRNISVEMPILWKYPNEKSIFQKY